MTIRATLEADGEVLDLDEISENGEGVQAVAGLTGFGLPPVDVQWFEGAGDGARLRNVRATQNSLDIPIHVTASDPDSATARAALQATVKRMSRIVCKPMVLKFYDDLSDPTAYKWCEVVRSGGGTYAYGTDTDGVREYNTILTVTAGEPYWRHSTDSTDALSGSPQINGTLSIDNEGSATAFPIWEIHGPLSHFILTSEDGEVLEWSGQLNSGDMLIIDTESATCIDQTGANRYSGFATAPQMFKLKPGTNNVSVFTEVGTIVNRTNYALYGSFGSSTHGFTPYDANATLAVSGGKLVLSPVIPSGKQFSTKGVMASTVITGLPAQETLALRVDVDTNGNATGWPTSITLNTGPLGSNSGDVGLCVFPIATNGDGSVYLEFTVPDSGQVTFTVSFGLAKSGTALKALGGTLDNLYVGLPGTTFDGDTPDTAAYRYDWTGTAHQSTSTETPLGGSDNAEVDVSFTPRDWQVI